MTVRKHIEKHAVINSSVNRREFLKLMGAGGCALCLAGLWGRPLPAEAGQGGMPTLGLIRKSPAAWFTPLEKKAVQCDLCPKNCQIARGGRGFCRVRENRDGRLVSLVYGNPCAFHLDPVEKNPFFMYFPVPRPWPWPRPDAISPASSARPGRFPRPARKRCSASISRPDW